MNVPYTNLVDRLRDYLPPELVGLIKAAGEMAERHGWKLYLVGGVVRDLFLGRGNLDIDLVVEGDAVALAGELTAAFQGSLMARSQFGTVKLNWNHWIIDLATARSESYSRPGALPVVNPGNIGDDLFRRDFTINALAIELTPGKFGTLIDPYGGRKDLVRRYIRVLHENSFIDDATRIWRALRYEQRLGFEIEPATLTLLSRDIPMLGTISGDRTRHELELALQEEHPEAVLYRAGELSALARLHPSLKTNGWLAQKFKQAREASSPDAPSVWLYLSLLVYNLTDEALGQLIKYLNLPRSAALILEDALSLKARLGELDSPALSPSTAYVRLRPYRALAITANLLADDRPAVKRNLTLYLEKWSNIKLFLTGKDLKRMGLPAGPRIKEIKELLLQARLDGRIDSREDEERLARELIRDTG